MAAPIGGNFRTKEAPPYDVVVRRLIILRRSRLGDTALCALGAGLFALGEPHLRAARSPRIRSTNSAGDSVLDARAGAAISSPPVLHVARRLGERRPFAAVGPGLGAQDQRPIGQSHTPERQARAAVPLRFEARTVPSRRAYGAAPSEQRTRPGGGKPRGKSAFSGPACSAPARLGTPASLPSRPPI
jgi:hypothetical protein